MTIAEDKFELVELLRRWIAGLRLEWVSVSQVRILPGECVSDDYQELLVASSNITVNIAAVGVNGLDTGVEAPSTWYYIWLIKDLNSNQVSGLISASSTTPTLPSGYTKKRLLGAVRNNTSSNFLNFFSCGEGSQRTIFYFEDIDSTLRILTNGSMTTWTPISLATVIPPISRNAIIQAEVTSADCWVRTTGTTPATSHLFAGRMLDFEMITDSAQQISYYVATPSGKFTVSVRGFCYRV